MMSLFMHILNLYKGSLCIGIKTMTASLHLNWNEYQRTIRGIYRISNISQIQKRKLLASRDDKSSDCERKLIKNSDSVVIKT